MAAMTKDEIDDILERVRTWPLERQADAAAMLLRMETHGIDPYDLSEAEIADLRMAEAEAQREEPVSDEEMKALFDRYRTP